MTPDPGSGTTDEADDATGGETSSSGSPSATTEGTTASGVPQLEISDGPVYDFGDVVLGESLLHSFTVTNVGDGMATGLTGLPLSPHFAYEGGEFPGLLGSCGDTLDVDDTCTVSVAFTPMEVGLHAVMLALAYDQGPDVTRPLAGGGTGSSANLLVNPGGEMVGSPPPGWTSDGTGEWATFEPFGDVDPVEGSNFIGADTGPNDTPLYLRQTVDVSAWASTIDMGLMRFSFAGQVRSLQVANDEGRMLVHYRDEMMAVSESWDSEWNLDDEWTSFDDERPAPEGTRFIQVELCCRKSAGNFCDAYFDDLQLVAHYP